MTRWQQTLEVARWEFARFVKWRQQFIGLAVMTVLGVGGGMIGRAVKNSDAKPATVAVVSAERLGFSIPAASGVRWDSTRVWNETDSRDAIERGDLDGALIVSSASEATVLVRKRSAWTEPLAMTLNQARQEAAIARLVVTPEQQASLFAPLELTTDFLSASGAPVAKSTRIAVLGLLMPQLVGMSIMSMPSIVSDYGTLALIVLSTLLGVAMWFSFMAAIAATIDDPNSSTRSLLLFLPMLPSVLALTLLSKAETTIAQIFSIFPLTSMSVLPVRLMLTAVPWWESAAAIVGLVLAVWLFRRLAGRIFSAAVLMHGKEPGVRELWRWLRA